MTPDEHAQFVKAKERRHVWTAVEESWFEDGWKDGRDYALAAAEAESARLRNDLGYLAAEIGTALSLHRSDELDAARLTSLRDRAYAALRTDDGRDQRPNSEGSES